MRNASRCLSLILLWAAWSAIVAGPAETKPDQLPLDVTIDEALSHGVSRCAAAAWTGYGLARARGIAKQYVPGRPFDAKAAETFALELESRRALVQAWSDLKASDPDCEDRYLDRLVAFRDAGFLAEYVWKLLHSASWSERPAGLKQAEFDAWAKDSLRDHRVETRAWVRVGSPGGKKPGGG